VRLLQALLLWHFSSCRRLWDAASGAEGRDVVGVVGAARVPGISKMWAQADVPEFKQEVQEYLTLPYTTRGTPSISSMFAVAVTGKGSCIHPDTPCVLSIQHITCITADSVWQPSVLLCRVPFCTMNPLQPKAGWCTTYALGNSCPDRCSCPCLDLETSPIKHECCRFMSLYCNI